MLQILKQKPADRAMQKRMKAWEGEAGFSVALKVYQKKEGEYQKTMREWEKARETTPEQTEQLTRLGQQADRLWKEKVESFFTALKVKRKAYQMEEKHQILEAKRKVNVSDKERAVIPKPVSH